MRAPLLLAVPFCGLVLAAPRGPGPAPALGATLPPAPAPVDAPPVDSGDGAGATMEATEFVDQDIRDVLRAVARAYGLNVVPWPEVKGTVNVALHRMPVVDALRSIVEPLGFELAWEGGAWQVRAPRPGGQGKVETSGRDLVTLSASNQELRAFVDLYARRTGLNLLVDRNTRGAVTGTLSGVEPVEGLKAILAANGFDLRGQGGAWIISAGDASPSAPSASVGRGGARVNLSVRRGLVTATLKGALVGDVVQALADQSGHNVITYGQLGGTVDATLRDVPFLEALELLLQGTPFTFALRDSVLLVGDRNPGSASGQALSTTEIYYLRHARVDKVLPLLPKTLPAQGLQAVPELNALLISGTTESNAKVKEFLETIDQEVPQVVLEAVIVEFYRGGSSELGISQGSDPSSTTSLVGPALGLSGTIGSSEGWKASVGPFTGTVGLLPQDFLLQLKAVENADKGRVLARPRLTTLNGQTASINVGNSDYFQVTTTDKDGVASSDYRAFNSGITLSITPYLTRSGQITAEIKPEIRTPRSTTGTSTDKPPSTSTRSLSTNVRLRDGETIVLGGLIQTTDLDNEEGVPLLSAIPLLGHLFRYHYTTKQTTELAIFITPHVQRGDDSLIDPSATVDRMEDRVFGTDWKLPFVHRDPLPAPAEDLSRRARPAGDSTPPPATPPDVPVPSTTAPAELPSPPVSSPDPVPAAEADPPVRLEEASGESR